MKKILTLFLITIISLLVVFPVLAEDKSFQNSGFAGIIPKLPQTSNDPELINDFVYPPWGPPCQRYTYTVTYRDQEGRKPEYMRIIFNGKPIEMEKQNPNDTNYKNGVTYIYKFVPNKLGSNFYYFETSNGLGKARAGIIDSPDNGPVLFKSAFDKNEIAVIDSQSGQKVLSYPTQEEWIGGIALSDDGKYLAAKTSFKIFLFDLDNPQKPLWIYEYIKGGGMVGGDVKGGIDISGDGSKIIASIGQSVLLFDKSDSKPVWQNDEVGNAYNVAISTDGKYMSAATAGEESNPRTNLLILWGADSEKPLWTYHSSGNFHDVSLSADGKYITAATGCPDRKFYVFSRDSNTPLIKSESLTRDSPVHRAKISADGTLAAVGSESDAGAVFLFNTNSPNPVWKFPTPNGSSVRALNFTPDGKYIGAATFGGQVYIFEKDKSSPVATWVVNAALGGVDIADDGSFIAAGGTDNKLHIFKRGKTTGVEITFDEYVEEIDISANGKYVAAGTGGSVYFFESINNDNKIFPCTTIIEPKPRSETMGENGSGQQAAASLCGDGKCEGPETIDNCKQDCDLNFKTTTGKPLIKNTQPKLPGMLFGFGFIGSVLLLGVSKVFKKYLIQFFASKFSSSKLTDRKITIFLLIMSILFLFLTIIAVLVNKNPDAILLKTGEQTKPEPGRVIMNQENKPILNEGKQKSGVCGNDICEPNLGETKENCPKDCSAGD